MTMQNARNAKGAPAGSSGQSAQSESVTDSTPQTNTDALDRKTRGGDLAEQIYQDGGLADRLRATRDRTPETVDADTPLRCAHCGELDPGFADSGHPAQSVECSGCGASTVLGRWASCGRLIDAVLETPAPGSGVYALGGWACGEVRVLCVSEDEQACEVVAVAWPTDGVARVHHLDVGPHVELVETLEKHGVTVREEG